ncbi:hypothetical protein GCM10023310_62310 [Paenibacillus vulneris]|uniref:NADH-quinone oxidoreductase subunit C n=1 Tax=Paenibacillus vulneris TaxID=1133364 RepID=A0ABW3UED4_9BACL
MSDEQKKDGLQPDEGVQPSANADTSAPEPQQKPADNEPESKDKPSEAAEAPKEAAVSETASNEKPGDGEPESAPARPPRPERKAAAATGDAAVENAAPAKAASADEDKEAKAKAAAEARAARASARAKKPDGEAEAAAPKEPSPNQPRLDLWVKLLKEKLGDDIVEEAFINERDAHLPYIVIQNERWVDAAKQLRDHQDFKMNYLRNVSGIDQETHMEVAYHMLSLETKQEICIKIKTNREAPSIPSVTPVWPTANWNEREIYDLLGIDFPGHPDLRRIMMSDDWVGHPLRKDYEPLDPEV